MPEDADANGITPSEWSMWRAFLAMQGQLLREIDRQLQRDSGIGQADYGVLAAVLEAPGRRLRIGELAELLGWERSRVSHQVARMERRGLVRRGGGVHDLRATEVTLTPMGRRTILGAVRGHATELRRRLLDLVEPDERAVLERVFTRVVDRMNPDFAALSERVTPRLGERRASVDP